MSYGKFQKEAGKYSFYRIDNNLPYLNCEAIDEIIRDKWIAEIRYADLIAFILENWDSGNCENFSRPLSVHLIENKELIFFKKLWKGILRHRLDKFWNKFDYLLQEIPELTIAKIKKIDITRFNQFSSDESLERTFAWKRLFIIEGIKEFKAGLEILNDYEEVDKQLALLKIVSELQKPNPVIITDKRKIDENLFWQIIDETRQISSDQFNFIDNLKLVLETFHPKELRKFDKLLIINSNALNTYEHWALAYIVRGGCGDDEFDYFRIWAVSKGQKAFLAIKTLDENQLKQIFNEDPQLEELYYLVEQVYESKTYGYMPSINVKANKLIGTPWAEEELLQTYPTLCKIFNYT